MRKRVLAYLLLLPLGIGLTGCRYVVKSKSYIVDLDYAQPKPGKFRYVKRNISVTTVWDSHESPESRGSEGYMVRMTSLMVQATKQLLAKANLQANQALYNVRISAPAVDDTYFVYALITAFFIYKSRYSVSITADVIEFI